MNSEPSVAYSLEDGSKMQEGRKTVERQKKGENMNTP